MRLTKNFTLEEMVASATAVRKHINNTPSADVKNNLQMLCEKVLQPIRDMYGKPMIITSGYRCRRLNTAVGGVWNSQHLKGEAADFVTKNNVDNKMLFDLIKKSDIPFDQLIWEKGGSWIHISYSSKRQRRQVLYT